MPNYHDEFWRFILLHFPNTKEFLQLLLKHKAQFLELKKLKYIENVFIKNKKIPIDLLFEIPLKKSAEKIYFLLEHKSRKEKNFLFQILQYKAKILEWQKVQYGRVYPVIPILFSQGLDLWDPETEIQEFSTKNPILPSSHPLDLLIFDLRKIDPTKDFQTPGLRAGMLLLKEISRPWDEFVIIWREVQSILKIMPKTKRVEMEDAMTNYIFKSRKEEISLLQELIMGRRVLTAYERAVEEGKREGILEGRLEGMLEGRLEGELIKALDTAKKMKEKGFSYQEITEITGLTTVILKENGII